MSSRLPSVFVIGSSTTLLMGPHLERMLHGVYSYSRKGHETSELRKALEDLDTPQGASAGDSSMVLKYLHSLARVETFRPDVVLMHVGYHDIKRDPESGEIRVSLDLFSANVREIVTWFKQRGIRLIWMRSGPLDEALHNARTTGFRRFESDLECYNKAADAILLSERIPTLDLAGFTRGLGPMKQLLKDHVHFTDDVVRLQAAFVAGYLAAQEKPLRETGGAA